jgi:hypothetical protein
VFRFSVVPARGLHVVVAQHGLVCRYIRVARVHARCRRCRRLRRLKDTLAVRIARCKLLQRGRPGMRRGGGRAAGPGAAGALRQTGDPPGSWTSWRAGWAAARDSCQGTARETARAPRARLRSAWGVKRSKRALHYGGCSTSPSANARPRAISNLKTNTSPKLQKHASRGILPGGWAGPLTRTCRGRTRPAW